MIKDKDHGEGDAHDYTADHANDYTADHSKDHLSDYEADYKADHKNDQLRMLLGRCVERDQIAFKQLYDATSAQLYATLRNMLRIEAVAEEALQEAYVKIWDKASDYKPELGQDGPESSTEHQDILEQCFGRLSQNQRECISRAYLEGLTHDELSVSVNSPVGTVKSWIRRGLITLKECVRELS